MLSWLAVEGEAMLREQGEPHTEAEDQLDFEEEAQDLATQIKEAKKEEGTIIQLKDLDMELTANEAVEFEDWIVRDLYFEIDYVRYSI